MKKVFSILLCAVMLLTVTIPAFSFTVDPKFQIVHSDGSSQSYSSLSDAVNDAADGDIVMLAGEVSSYTETNGITITKNITFKTGKDFGGNKKYVQYNGTSAPLFTVEDGGSLTITDADILGNTNSSLSCGGFVYVKSGGTLIIDGKAGSEVTVKNFRLNSADAKGGVVYVEGGGTVVVNGAAFTNNYAASGSDVYAERKSDVTLAQGVTANTTYGISVDISGLSLVLSGDIGLVFYTEVPDKYTSGKFVLTCRTGETVECYIKNCPTDGKGRYIVQYHPSAVELSEQVTLTVIDRNGNELAAKSKSVEDYGKVILADKNATEKDKNIVTKLLNYGHYAQIDCAAANGLEIGKDIAETAKYADLTVSEKVFNDYAGRVENMDDSIGSVGLQLSLAYRPGMKVCLRANKVPTVTVNGKEAKVLLGEGYYNYVVQIDNIGIENLAKNITVCINDKMTVVFSPLTYCLLNSAASADGMNAAKALFEFYLATTDYDK